MQPRSKTLMLWLGRLLVVVMGFWGATTAAFATDRPLTIFAAASLKNVLDDLIEDYGQTLGDRPVVSYAASSALARQIEYGAPADVFLSANADWAQYLVDRNLLNGETLVDVASNELVLIAGTDWQHPVDLSAPATLIEQLGEEKLAIALVRAVPAGIYGRQALEFYGLWDQLRPKVAQTENTRATLRLVATGATPLGIVYASDAAAEPRVRVLAAFAESSHDPIRYQAGQLTHPDADGGAFLDFLQSEGATAVFKQHGFRAPLGGQP